MMGLVAAVEAYLAEDEAARFAEWEQISAYLEDELGQIPGLQTKRVIPTQPYIQPAITPRVAIQLDGQAALTNSSLKLALWEGDPAIAVETIQGQIILNTHTLTMPEAQIIIDRFKQIVQ